MQLHGGVGYTGSTTSQLYLKRSKWARPAFGDADFHYERVARLGGLLRWTSSFTPEEEAFRDEVRAFLDENLPDGREHAATPGFLAEWNRKVREKRWVGFSWPKEVGGGGGSIMEQVILKEEMAKRKAPPLGTCFMGLAWVGPAIIQYGTEAQKQRFIPDILDGKYQWCTGYSEPGSGSDLASLAVQVRARGRSLRGQRPEDLDVDRDVVEVDHPAGAHRPERGSEARRHHLPARRDVDARASRCARSRTCRAARCSPRCSSTTCACRSRTGSARKGRAGRSRCRRSRTSARRSPRSTACTRKLEELKELAQQVAASNGAAGARGPAHPPPLARVRGEDRGDAPQRPALR